MQLAAIGCFEWAMVAVVGRLADCRLAARAGRTRPASADQSHDDAIPCGEAFDALSQGCDAPSCLMAIYGGQ